MAITMGPTMPIPPEQEMRLRIARLEAENAAIKAWIAATFPPPDSPPDVNEQVLLARIRGAETRREADERYGEWRAYKERGRSRAMRAAWDAVFGAKEE